VPEALFVGKGYRLDFEDIRRKFASREGLLRKSAELALASLLYEVVGGTGQARERGASDLYVTEALSYMQSGIAERLEVEGLAMRLGIDKSYFIRIFTKAMGMPPLRYFTMLKMDTARYLLRHDSMPIHGIAEELGYRDEFYFSRAFKRCIGASPSAYRAGGGGLMDRRRSP
jgi:iron complex transport system substrate-binding protein